MGSMINTNVASLSAQRSLAKSQDSLNGALQRLSSGLRINSAKDDAAGLAITTRMTSQINGMNQAVRNANDGISLAQTADSSLDEVTNNLQRIRDLALQAANGTNSADDRSALDVEVQQRLAEVNRIASQTTFNGINLLDGSFKSQAFQIGASANQTVTVDSISSAKTSDLGLGTGAATGTALASTVASKGITAGSLSINGSTVTTDATTNSAKALTAAINGNATITASGVTAVATNSVNAAFTDVAVTKAGKVGAALTTAVPSVTGSNLSNLATKNGSSVSGTAVTTGTDIIINGTGIASTASNAKQLAADINAQSSTTGVTATATAAVTRAVDSAALQTGSVTLGARGSSYSLTVGGVSIYEATATGATGAIAAANIDGNAVAVTNATLVSGRGGLGDSTVQANLAAAGITYTGTAAAGTLQFKRADGGDLSIHETIGTTSTGNTTSTATAMVTATDLVINGTGIATTATDNKQLAADINAQSATTGVTARANSNSTKAADSTAFAAGSVTLATGGSYKLTVGGVDIYQTNAATGASSAIAAANIDGNAVAVTNTTLVSGKGGLGDATVQANLAAAGISVSGTAAGGNLVFTRSDGSNVAMTETVTGVAAAGTSFVSGGNVTALGATTVTRRAAISLTSASAMTITGNDNGAKSGVLNGRYGGANVKAAGVVTSSAAAVTTGTDVIINGSGIASTATTAKQLATDINAAAVTGITATADVNATKAADSTAFAAGSFTLADTATYTLSVGGVDIYAATVAGGASGAIAAANLDGDNTAVANTTLTANKQGLGNSGTKAALEAAGITFTGTAAGGNLKFFAQDGSNLNIVETVGVAVGVGTSFVAGGDVTAIGATTNVRRGSVSLTSTTGTLVVTGADNGTKTGLANGTYSGNVALTGTAPTSTAAVTTGTDLVINGSGIASTATDAKTLAANINTAAVTGVTATADVNTTKAADSTAFAAGAVSFSNTSTYALSVGGVNIYQLTGTGAGSIAAANLDGNATAVTNGTLGGAQGLGTAGVKANLEAAGITFTGTAAAGTLKFFASDGSNLNIVETTGGTAVTGTSFVSGGTLAAGATTVGRRGTVSLTSTTGSLVVAGNDNGAKTGFANGTYGAGTTSGTSFVNGGNAAAPSSTTVVREGSVSLSSSQGSIVVTGADNGTKTGITNGTYSSGIAAGTLSINDSVITTAAGTTNSAKALAAAINAQASVTGVNATAQTTSTTAADSTAFKNGSVVLAAATTNNYTLTVGGVSIYSASGSASGSTTITAAALDGTDVTLTNASSSSGGLGSTVVQAALTAAGITYSGSAVAGTLKFQKADGSNIAMTETIGGASASGTSFLTGNTTLTAGTRTVTDTSNVVLTSASAIKVSGSSATTSGLINQSYGGIANQATKTGSAVTGAALFTSTDLVINGTGIATTAADAKQLAKDINALSQTTGVNAVANTTVTSSADSLALKNGSAVLSSTGTYTLSVGGVDIYQTNAATGTTSAITAANIDGDDVAVTNATLASGKKGLGNATVLANLAAAGITFTGTAAAGTLQFKKADGSDIAITETVGVVAASGTSFVSGGSLTSTRTNSVTDHASITLNSANSIVVTGNDNGTKSGIANGTYAAATTSQLTINGTSIATDATTVGADKIAAAINLKTTTTGVTATALATDTGALGSFTTTSTAGYGLTVNGVKVIDSASSAANITAASIDSAIATTGSGSVGANLAAAGITTTGTAADGTLRFLSATGANINVVETQGGIDLAGFGKKTATTANEYSSTITLSSSSAIAVGGTDSSKMGLTDGTSNIVNQQGTALSSTVASGGIAAGSLSINGSTIVTSAATNSAQLLAAAINDLKDTTKVTATVGKTTTSATLFGGSDAPSFNNVSTAATSTYSLAVGGVTVASQAASTAAGSGVTRASIDAALATSGTGSVGNNLALAGITFTGSAVKGDLKFTKTDGTNLAVTEVVTGTVAGGVGHGAGVANTGGTVETATAAVTLSSTGNIVVAGSSSTTAGFSAGTVGADKKYTLSVGDGETTQDLSFDLSKGQFGTSVKATDVASAINSDTTLQGLKITAAVGTDGKLTLSAADGRNITLKETTNDRVNFSVTGTSGFADADAGTLSAGGVPATAVSHMGQVSLSATKDLTVAGTDATKAGLTAGSFSGANVKSVEAANATLTAIDAALKNISSSRASLGAYQNRFASTVANLQANAESLTASRSRIMDADFATETAALSRGQILQQAGTAMLAQANQLPNGVLSLLRG